MGKHEKGGTASDKTHEAKHDKAAPTPKDAPKHSAPKSGEPGTPWHGALGSPLE